MLKPLVHAELVRHDPGHGLHLAAPLDQRDDRNLVHGAAIGALTLVVLSVADATTNVSLVHFDDAAELVRPHQWVYQTGRLPLGAPVRHQQRRTLVIVMGPSIFLTD